MAAIGTGIRARAGQVLATEGSVGRQVFLVEEGRVAVERHGNRIAVLTAGAIAGETAVLSGAPRNATLVAETDLVVTVYTPAEFSELLAAVTPPA